MHSKKTVLNRLVENRFISFLFSLFYPFLSLFHFLKKIYYRFSKVVYSQYLIKKISGLGSSSFGSGVYFSPKVRVECKKDGLMKIGNDVNIDDDCVIKVFSGGELVIEDDVYIGPGTHIYVHNKTTIGAHSMVAPYCFIVDHDHVVSREGLSAGHTDRQSTHDIVLGHDVWLGAQSIVAKGVAIGSNAIVGAGTVVTKNVDSGQIAVGASMRIIEK